MVSEGDMGTKSNAGERWEVGGDLWHRVFWFTVAVYFLSDLET